MARYRFLKGNEIKPEGWLKDQLEIQLKGLSGNLDFVWPDIGDSGWLGGSRESWERMPYWLDGALPLAFLTGDKCLQGRVCRYIQKIMDRQEEDGWICPCTKEERPDYDTWAAILVCKALAGYYRYTGDEKAIDCIEKAMKCELTHIRQYPIHHWDRARWFEAFIPLQLLKSRKPEAWIDELAALLHDQGLDWGSLEKLWITPEDGWHLESHIVNLMMALKTEALYADFMGIESSDYARRMLDILDRWNGTAADLVIGDECLAGISPIHGTEFCAVVEQAYSYEWLFAITGDPFWSDKLERVAYNGFAATMTKDMWAHQYDQMANQIACVPFPRGDAVFKTNGPDSHIFGLEPNYGCCTANFSQGWPKLVASLFVKNEDELVNTAIGPCSVRTAMHGVPVEVKISTEYPFRNTVRYTVKTDLPVRFKLGIRVPSWAEEALINGEKTDARGTVWIDRTWSGENEVVLTFTCTPRLTDRPDNMKCVNYGALLFSLPIKARWETHEYTVNNIKRQYPYCDYWLYREGEFAYAFSSDSFKVVEAPLTAVPFSEENPPLRVLADMVKIDWGFEYDDFDTVCAKHPHDTKPLAPARTIALQPYGSTLLRMTEMPLANKAE